MYKIVIGHLQKIFNHLFYSRYETDMLYNEIISRLYKTNTLSDLYFIKKLLFKYEKIMIKYNNPPQLVKNFDEMNNIWMVKYKLWKRRD